MDAKLLAQWSINVITVVFVVGQLVRSVKLGKGFSDTTIKMYLGVFLLCIVSNLSIANILPPDVLNSALFAAIGFVFGATLKD
jgi:hypothetical protein